MDEESPICLSMPSQQLGPPGRQPILGTDTGLVGGVSKFPWVLRPLVLLQKSVFLKGKYCVEPNWRFSRVYSNGTLCSGEIKTGLLNRNGNGGPSDHPGNSSFSAQRNPVKNPI